MFKKKPNHLFYTRNYFKWIFYEGKFVDDKVRF